MKKLQFSFPKNIWGRRSHLLVTASPFFIVIASGYLVIDSPIAFFLVGWAISLALLALNYDGTNISNSHMRYVDSVFVVLFYAASQIERLMMVPAIIFFYEVAKGKLSSRFVGPACCTFQILLFLEIAGYWGVPFTAYFIWFWGVPVALCIMALFLITNFKPVYIVSALLALAIILNQFALQGDNVKCFGVINEKPNAIPGISTNTMINISSNTLLVGSESTLKKIEAGGEMGRWLIISPSTPNINDSMLRKNAKVGEYYVFGEHDNLGGFVNEGSIFNIDSIRRRGPWHTYHPVMTRILNSASQKDPSYCSNIGSTLSVKFYSYPLIWSYNVWGKPSVVACGEFHNQWRLTCIGDADPAIGFLSMYNPHFLRSLTGFPEKSELVKGIILFLLVIIIGTRKKKRISYYLITIVLSFSLILSAYLRSNDECAFAEISVSAKGDWLSPHLDDHFSSLPKTLSQQGLTVHVERPNCPSKINLVIVNKKNVKIESCIKTESETNMIFALPGSSLLVNGTEILVEDIPLALRSVSCSPYELCIHDARNLVINGKAVGSSYRIANRTYVIGTNSPQAVEGIGSLVHD